MSIKPVKELLSGAVDCLNGNRIDDADALLAELLSAHGDVPQAIMLMGAVRLRQKRYGEAKALLGTVLQVHPDQPVTLHYLGDVFAEEGNLPEAVAAYRKALAARPHYRDTELALAAALKRMGHLEEAKQCYDHILAQVPDSPQALAGLGDTLIQMQAFAAAATLLAKGERLVSDGDLAAEMSERLGYVKFLQRRFAEALPHFERALVVNPAMTEAQRRRATTLEHLGQLQRAADAYRKILKNDPGDLKTHLLLNELINRTGPADEFLASYDAAARQRPASAAIPSAKGDQLLLMERTDEASEAYRRALRLDPSFPPALIGLGRVLSKLGDERGASETFEGALEIQPDNVALKTAFAYHLLRTGDNRRAMSLAESAAAAAPHDQAALAVLGLSYRSTNDAREDDLNNYEHLIRVFDLEPPPGYTDIDGFHGKLGVQIDQIHQRAGQYFSQTLRGGTRASEAIFEFHEKSRDLLKAQIVGAVSHYISDMPARPDHAFWGRRTDLAFQFTGSWSSRMKAGGFHANHIHDGWISSVYYVNVPEATADPLSHQGWLKFGEPPPDLNFRDAIRRLVRPRPGRLVLFPSYMWHGTVPFHTDEVRTTIAFDAVPYRVA